MYDAGGVGGGQGGRDLLSYKERFSQRQGALQDPLAQGDSVNVLHRNEMTTVLCLADLMNDADVGVAQRRSRAGFLSKAAHAILIPGKIRRKKLERNFSTQPRVIGKVDFAHSAGGERRHYLVGTDLLACDEASQT